MKNSDCFYVWMIYEISSEYQGYPRCNFDFAKSLDNIDFIRFRFFGLLDDDFSMNVNLYIDESINTHYFPIRIYKDVEVGRNKTDIEGLKEINEEYEKNKAELDEYIDITLNKIKDLALILFTTNIDIIKYGKDFFGSIPLYFPHCRITISYVVGLKYSSQKYFEPGITLFNSKIAKGSINLDWGSHDEFFNNVVVSNPFLGLYDIFVNHATNLALKLVIQNDNFYFTIMFRDDCMVYTLRFYFGGVLGPYGEIEIIVCLDINFKDALNRIKNSINDFYKSIKSKWRPFVLGVCLGVLIGLAPIGVAIEAGLSTAYATVSNVVVTNVYVGLGSVSTTVTNWLTKVNKIDFIKTASDQIGDFTSGLVTEFQSLQVSISFWLQGFVNIQPAVQSVNWQP